MKKNIEHKIEETLQSLEGIERANASPFLFGKIMNRMQAQRSDPVYSGRVILRYALLALILVGINVLIIYKSDKKAKDKMVADAFANEYFVNAKTFEY